MILQAQHAAFRYMTVGSNYRVVVLWTITRREGGTSQGGCAHASPPRTGTKAMGASLRSRQEFVPVNTNFSCLFIPSFYSSFPPTSLGATAFHVLEKETAGCSFTEKGILSQSVKRHNFKTPFLKGRKKKSFDKSYPVETNLPHVIFSQEYLT